MVQDKQAMAQPDELIDFHHLKARRGMSQLELEDEVATDLQKATGLVDTHTTDSSHLNRVLQLTGALDTRQLNECDSLGPRALCCGIGGSILELSVGFKSGRGDSLVQNA